MPATVEGLADVGLRDLPTWWTAAMGLTLSNMGGGGSGSLGLGMPGTGGAGPYDVRMAGERMIMFGGGKKGREFREMARMGHGHGYGQGQGQRKEREVRAAKEVMTPLDRGRVKFKGVGAALAASSEDKVMVLGGKERSSESQAVLGTSEKGREEVVRQTQQAGVQRPEKLVDV